MPGAPVQHLEAKWLLLRMPLPYLALLLPLPVRAVLTVIHHQ